MELGCETGPFPSFSRRSGCAINKKIPFLSGADGVVCKFQKTKVRYAGAHYNHSLRKTSFENRGAVADAWPQVIAFFNKYLKTRGETNAQHFHGSDAAAVSASRYRRHRGRSQNSLQRLWKGAEYGRVYPRLDLQ